MDTFQFLISVFLVLLKCEEFTMQHITFSYTKKSWKDAVNHCTKSGGVLESNVTLLMEQNVFKNANKNNDEDEVWIGKFRTLTNWTYIRGCYLINGNFQNFELELSNTTELQCQMLCNNYKFYSIKGTDCYCIDDIDSFDRSTDCNCVGCYKVWEHRLSNFGKVDNKDKCIAAIKCKHGTFKHGYEECTERLAVICDNDAKLEYNYSNYTAASDECNRRGSFIKWHSLCNSTNLPQYWTSGTRQDETFVIKRKGYLTENLQPDKCFILKEQGKEAAKKNCNTPKFFFCRFDDMLPSQKNALSDNSGSIAAGTVTSIIVVIVVISVIVFIYRRRLSRRKPTSHESQNNSRLQDTAGLASNHEISKAPIYHEIDTDNFVPRSGNLNCSRTVNNITYDQAPNSKNLNQSANSSILTNLNSIEHQRKVGQTEYDMPKLINETGNSSEGANSSNYCLAEPIATYTEEELDPYDINKDYDHLNNVQKKEDQITKVYDHLPTTVTDDPTYDHSNLNSALDNEDYYDHFKNEGDHD